MNNFVGVSGNTQNLKVLGNLTWYSIPDNIYINQRDLEQAAKSFNVPNDFLPPKIRKVDAFRRATSEAVPSKRDAIIRLSEIVNDEDQIIRIYERPLSRLTDGQLLKMNTDTKVSPNYEHIGTAVFHRKTDSICTKCLVPEAEPILREAQQLFRLYGENYTSDAIRRMTKEGIKKLNGISMRKSGGVEFVPISNESTLNSLAKLLSTINNECEIFTVPLIPRTEIEAEEQKRMIGNKAIADVINNTKDIAKLLGGDVKVLNAKNTTKDLIGEYRKILTGGRITNGKLKEAINQFTQSKELIKEYESLLEVNLSELHEDVNIIQQQLKTMMNKVEDEG